MSAPVPKTIESSECSLRLYHSWDRGALPLPVVPSSSERDWVNAAAGGPYRGLPIQMPGEIGCSLLSPARFTVVWDGSESTAGIEIQFEAGEHFDCVKSHFGHGILTFAFPYLFRTAPGINLWVRGPANWSRDGIQALEAIVETDWADYPFTMNWKLTRPRQRVTFEIGDPVCVLVPFPRHFLEQFQPEVLEHSPESGPRPHFESEYWAAFPKKPPVLECSRGAVP